MSTDREAIARRIRALRAKTQANGCTEAEAISAAEMLATLLARYNMTLDEAEVRESPFKRHTEEHTDFVGTRLFKIADGVAHLVGVRYWQSRAGVHPIEINFFGFAYEVEVAQYLLEICAGAMRREQARHASPLISPARLHRKVGPFLDGMADRLRERIRALKPPAPPGTGLVLLKNSLVDRALKDEGVKTEKRPTVSSRDLERGYRDGLSAGDRVALNRGLAGTDMGLRRIG